MVKGKKYGTYTKDTDPRTVFGKAKVMIMRFCKMNPMKLGVKGNLFEFLKQRSGFNITNF